MSIKTRLVLSYIAMTFVPVVVFAIVAATLVSSLSRDAAGEAQGRGIPAFWKANNERGDLIAGIRFMAEADPGKFADGKFVRDTDERLNRLHAGLVIAKDGEIVFRSGFLNGVDLPELLGSATADASSDRGWGHDKGDRLSAEKFDVAFGGGKSGTAYVVSDLSSFYKEVRKVIPLLVLSLLLVIGLTNGLLTLLVSRNLIKPLRALQNAAERIKEGDLSREVTLKRKDEIGKLGAAFEDMRGRLQESIRLQLQYEDNRKELISNISHDLKTPITGIKACVEAIRDGIADTEPKREKYVGMIEKKTDEMDRMIDELFLFSKLDLKTSPFHLEPVDLAAYMNDCVEELRLHPRPEEVEMTFSFTGEGPLYVMADREKLRRVIMNIVDNSTKYLDKERKKIAVELIDGTEYATVRIRDNGSGIASEALPHVFDRFYRAEPSRNSESGGSGLGLAIVKQIVEGHGGSVSADSREGEGACISFTLPRTGNGGERV